MSQDPKCAPAANETSQAEPRRLEGHRRGGNRSRKHPENGDFRYDEPDGELPEEDDDNPYQESDEAMPEDREERAISRDLSKEGSRFDEV